MKKFPAMALVEFNGIAVGMHATDAMLKKSPINLLKCGTISRGHYLTVVAGTTASVDEALDEGLFLAGDNVVDSTFLPDIDTRLHNAILGQSLPMSAGAIAVMETPTVCCNVRAAEMALKGTPVELVEIRLGDSQMGGRGMSIFQGELHDIEASIDIAVAYLQGKNIEPVYKILTAPHEGMLAQIENSTRFLNSTNLELEGEFD
ncbi:MAG TPA: BMC domain-containing protein [Kiritimatiellia bacterium]|nr:BMC domain-containing protein [Kiritimatiellia bacterium]HNR93868.1 BMC domain-containing protein [Kiritimatiellia bacterium]HNS80459.1 BMC domain-containing protein [Kiritimatiellia bacterium]HPA77284.1 BMC domain-containing protein [Kiritimatiellia bacterium]HQQ03228.1 BMC domain-containing protein [Kiritimatiellia bacterium]